MNRLNSLRARLMIAFMAASLVPLVIAAAVTIPAFVLDERTLVRDASGAEVVSSTTVHCGFDVTAPPGSLVTVWPGVAGEREAEVITSGRAAHPRLPAYQTLSLT